MQLEHAIGFKKSVQIFEADLCLPLPQELIGVELEVEGVRHSQPVPPLWREVPDDSLRNYGREYIFSEPLYGTGITDALMDMAIFMDKVQPDISYRCSVHVHLNVSDMDMEQLLTLLTLYLIFERTLVKYHGGGREDNIFCIPYYKAPASMQSLVYLYKDAMAGELLPNYVSDLLSDFNKYSALNINAVLVHGSIEFRHMPGTTDMVEVFEWIKMVQYLKKAALEGDLDYMSLVEGASGSTSSLLQRVFNESAELLQYPDMTNDIMAGARLAQRMINGSKFGRLNEEEISRRYNRVTNEKIANVREMLVGKAEVAEVPVTIDEADGMVNLEGNTIRPIRTGADVWRSYRNAPVPPPQPVPARQRQDTISGTRPDFVVYDDVSAPTPEDMEEMEQFLASINRESRGTE